MKIEKKKAEFEPVCITLETHYELHLLNIILSENSKGTKLRWENTVAFSDELLQKLNN